MSRHDQKIYLGIGVKGDIETLGKWVIEDFNRDDLLDVITDLIDLVYDGVDEDLEGNDE